ncbi:hypothetical protein PMAYCL1PPCAC_16354, partial [Pristionchus mayeri]
LLGIIPCALSLHILMYVNVVGKSHVQFAEKLIELLNENGHTVDLIMGALNSYVKLKGSYSARKLVTVEFPGEIANHLINPFVEVSDWDRLMPNTNKFLETCDQLCDLLITSSDVAELMSSNKYDLALLGAYDFCPFALAHHHKISPVVSYAPTPAHFFQQYHAGIPDLPLYDNILFDTRHADYSNFATRVFEALRTFKERWMFNHAYKSATRTIRAHFGENFPDLQEIVRNVSLDFTNSHPLLEEPKPISHRLRYIGGIGLPKPKPLSKDINNLLDLSKKGNVIFSFGTQIEPDKFTANLQRVFVNTFERFPEYNFLWKFDGTTQFNASNLFNIEWLPQTDLLYDSRVVAFISHMGLNSFTEVAHAGVPVVAIPIFADQIHNARCAVALGTAEMVRKTEITEENLTRALEKVLFEERYRSRAKEIAAMISALPDTPQRVFLEGIEFAAKFKNLSPHFRLAGADYNFLVQMGWDVVAFLTLSMILCLYLSLRLLVFALSKIPKLELLKLKID